MKKFTNLERNLCLEDFIYSEIMALMIMNPPFFDFLNQEKNKYVMNDMVFQNSFLFEVRKHNIKVSPDFKPIFPFSIEKNWDYLLKTFEISKNFNANTIEINNQKMIIDNDIFRNKYISDTITNLDIQNVLNLQNVNTDNYILDYINIINEYIKPQYQTILNYFIIIFKESNQTINYNNFMNFKVQGLGYRCEELPKLYYNSFADFCKDILLIENCFRDYQLMIDKINDTKLSFLKTLIPNINNNNFINFYIKYLSLDNQEYFSYIGNNVQKMPSKNDIKIELKPVIIKYNKNKDIIVYMNDLKFVISIDNCELIYNIAE